MIKNKQLFAVLMLTLLSFSACVSSKQYNTLLLSKDQLQRDYDMLKGVQREKQLLTDSVMRQNDETRRLNTELEDWKTRFASLYSTNEEITQQLEQLRYQNQEILATSTGERDVLRRQLDEKLRDLDERERKMRLLEAQMKTSQGSVDELKNYLSEREKQIKELSDALKQRDEQMAQMRQSVTNALSGFNANELSVRQENGKVYVTLSEGLLFTKGSSAINAKGTDAVRKLANALVANPEINVTVEGHTDPDGAADANWILSTARAQSVLRVLITNRVDPRRLTAAGRAFYAPVAPNDSEANKAKNRRTEIILSPKLDELYNIIKTN